MNKNIIYLYPEVEGTQNFVCWGFKKEDLAKRNNQDIKAKVMEALKLISEHKNPWISKRSFSVYLGEDKSCYWVAIPRELTAKAMKALANKLAELKLESQLVITSQENPFGNQLPFEAVISYDRGFTFDSSKIDRKLATQKISNI